MLLLGVLAHVLQPPSSTLSYNHPARSLPCFFPLSADVSPSPRTLARAPTGEPLVHPLILFFFLAPSSVTTSPASYRWGRASKRLLSCLSLSLPPASQPASPPQARAIPPRSAPEMAGLTRFSSHRSAHLTPLFLILFPSGNTSLPASRWHGGVYV